MLKAIVEHNVHVGETNVHIFEDETCMFRHLKTPDIILFLVSSQKLHWTRTFDTYCSL